MPYLVFFEQLWIDVVGQLAEWLKAPDSKSDGLLKGPGGSNPSLSATVFVGYWRDGRVAEGARLEIVYTVTGIEGSNPSFSAIAVRLITFKPRQARKGATVESK